jgi:integrase
MGRSTGWWDPTMKLPRYINAYVDHTGKARYYLRRAGFKSVALPGIPWSAQFMQAYESAMAGQPAPIGSARVLPGSMHALMISYYSSPDYLRMQPSSKQVRKNILERFCRETDANGLSHGDKRAALLQRDHIVRFMAARTDKPESANGLRKALRAVMRHAIDIKMRSDDPTQGIRKIAPKSKRGFHSWDEQEIVQFQNRFPIGSKPRLALELGLWTGQARQDVVAMGPQHIREGCLSWVRAKTAHSTGIEIFIDETTEIRQIIDATPSGHLTFLVTEFGKPFAPAGFGNWFRRQCNAAGLPHCSFHGLRKAAARRMAESGCTPHEIAAITGHATLKEVARYTEAANRKRLAKAAMQKVKLRTVSA